MALAREDLHTCAGYDSPADDRSHKCAGPTDRCECPVDPPQFRLEKLLHDRIPMVTPEEQRAVQEENFKDDERFWDTMRDLNAASVEEHKSLIASAEAKLKGHESAAADAGEKLETAKSRLQRLQRGESVSGGLGKKLDIVAIMKAAGITLGDLRRMRLYGSLTKREFESLLEPTRMKRRLEAADRVFDREARRIIRARR
jgi:hypothetical protein